MSDLCTISNIHIRKLDHAIDEIRERALNNVLSKLDFGYECACDAVKKELLVKLFNWFLVEPYMHEGKVLDLIIRLIKSGNGSYLNSFGRMRFLNEVKDLRTKLDSKWHDKLNVMENIASDPSKYIENYGETPAVNNETLDYNYQHQNFQDISDTISVTAASLLDGSMSFDLTNDCGDGIKNAVVPQRSESSIKWLVMPWQTLAQSDKAVLAKVEDSLQNSTDVAEKIENCKFITNIMLQDFPAEVLLHRPNTIHVLLALLDTYKHEHNLDSHNLIIAILKTLHKLSRALRFRIYYYCDPSIAHKPEKILLRIIETIEENEPDQTQENSSLMIDTEEESVLQLRQMSIPNYCTETLINVLKLLSIPNEASRPLNIVRYIADLVYELVQLFITSVMPTVWFCNDNIALKIHNDVKIVLDLLSEILNYFGEHTSIDYYRITYIHFLWISVKLMSNIVPLELADQVIPKEMKLSICNALMDAPVYLMYNSLHVTLREYAKRFRGPKETDYVKLLDETRLITKSMKAAVSLMKTFTEQTYSEELKTVYSSKLSLLYHKNFKLIRQFIKLAQNKVGYKLSAEDKEITTKMLLGLLAHSDADVQEATYSELYTLVTAILGTAYNARYSWKNLAFLLEPTVLIEIICHGTTNENKEVQSKAEDILTFFLKGQVQLTDAGWLKFLEALLPVLPLLQCLAHPESRLGKSIINMLDPDLSSSMKLPFIEVLKGNIRFLFSPNPDVKEEALRRIIYLLGQEKNSALKLPRLSSLYDLPRNSLFAFDKQISSKRSDGNYQKSALISVLEMLQTSNIDPKMRKSALGQISVMMSDPSLHKLFVSENGLTIILDIFSKALTEKDFSNYPDSVIPIVTTLKHLVSSESSVRLELSNRIDVYYNILRSLFLFSNNECIKGDAPHLLALLLYSGQIMRLTERTLNNPYNISLPYLITINMRLPFTCKAHWKTSVHRRSDISILHRNNPIALTFIRQYWAWQWNDGEKVLWKKWEDINDPMITDNLRIRESELSCLGFTSLQFYVQRQLFNIQNAQAHEEVLNALDYLTMYLKLGYLLDYENVESIAKLPWANTFERFLNRQPQNWVDYDLFTNVLNFLHLYLKILNSEEAEWVCRLVRNILKSIENWLPKAQDDKNVHQSVFKLTRACTTIDTIENEESQRAWINFVQFTVTHVVSGEFYDLAVLDWVLSTLTYVIGKCRWKGKEDTLITVGAALIQLILSFLQEGNISFMGLTNIRNCIICLNHAFYQMQNSLNENHWIRFWYGDKNTDQQQEDGLSWLRDLWNSRDPLVRASALQLLGSLINGPHTALLLLNAIDSNPEALCHTLLSIITCRDEACIVKEKACLAMSNFIKNSTTVAFQYSNEILAHAKECNLYHEISVMCANCYMLVTLDTDLSESSDNDGAQTQSLASSRTATSVTVVPKTVYYLHNRPDDIQGYSAGNNAIADDDQMEFITTPSLIMSLCSLLNNLITVGGHAVIREIFEHSVHKHLIGCFGEIPKNISGDRNLEHYSSVLEMYTNLCTVLTNCLLHGTDFASIVTFSPEFISHLFDLLNKDLYFTDSPTLVYLRNRLGTEILNYLVSLSVTANQHADAIQVALETCNIQVFAQMLCHIIKNSRSELGMSAISFLAFLLSLEMQKECEDDVATPLKDVLDTTISSKSAGCWDDELGATRTALGSPPRRDRNKNCPNSARESYIGAEICRELMLLCVALNHTKPMKKSKLLFYDRAVITVALSNLLSVSLEAKKVALEQNFPNVCLMSLKDIYVKFNSIPIQTFKTQMEQKKTSPLIKEVDSLYVLLMNFMYDSAETKAIFAKAGLADVVHKLWAHTSMNKEMLITSLKLLSTFTSNCSEAAQTLPLTSVTPGVGLRKTPNSMSLVHVIVQLIVKEIDLVGRRCDCVKLSLAFLILRNAIHSHDCRVVISKGNLLQFFTKIHPSTTKRTKQWQVVELNCLEFLIDFTFYEEGQLYVSKAVDSLDVLISLARISSGSIKLLAMSILRNLAFNQTNRSRLLGSVDFLDLLLMALKEGSSTELQLAGSTLWSLIGNSQKGKLIARNAGFARYIRTAISRLELQLSVLDSGAGKEERELVQMLDYVLSIMSPQ